MIIVKRKGEIIRFGLFLLLIGLMAWFVASRVAAWRMALQAPPVPATAAVPQSQGQLAPAVQTATRADFFAEFRMERERTRSALLERLREVMEGEAADPEARRLASLQYLRAGETQALESRAEAMLKARGFDDGIVSLGEGNAQVVLRTAHLTQQQYLQVVDMISKVAGLRGASVQVMARER